MSLSRKILVELPALRRFTRALVGDQKDGDAQIETLLNMILMAPEEALAAPDLRLFLYAKLIEAFHECGAPRSEREGSVANNRSVMF